MEPGQTGQAYDDKEPLETERKPDVSENIIQRGWLYDVAPMQDGTGGRLYSGTQDVKLRKSGHRGRQAHPQHLSATREEKKQNGKDSKRGSEDHRVPERKATEKKTAEEKALIEDDDLRESPGGTAFVSSHFFLGRDSARPSRCWQVALL